MPLDCLPKKIPHLKRLFVLTSVMKGTITSALQLACLSVLILSVSAITYDFIIAGAGSAGSTVAYRLSENPNVTVLLLDRGGDNCEIYQDAVGFWNSIFTFPPEEFPDQFSRSIYDRHTFSREANSASAYILQPTQLGGAGLRNGNGFGRMSAAELAAYNSSLWTYEATNQDWKDLFTFQKCLEGPCDTHSHGTEGPLIYDDFEPDQFLSWVNEAYKSVYNLSQIPDSNAGEIIGMSRLLRNIKIVNGKPVRQEPFCNLVKPVIAERPNLTVLGNALVSKIELGNNGEHRVKYYHKGESYSAKAKKEVILAASPIQSVQILKLSGIGPCDELNHFNITCVHSNNDLGENMYDNPTFGIVYAMPPPPNSSPGSIVVGYDLDKLTGLAEFEIAASTIAITVNHPIYGPITVNGILAYFSDYEHGGYGSVRLRSTDILDDPVITANMYSQHPEKISNMVEHFKKARSVFKYVNDHFAPIFEQASPTLDVLPADASDAQIEAYLRGPDGFLPSWHWTGSLSMHKVVDERLRLIDGAGNIIPGLRAVGNGVAPNNLKSHSTSSHAMFVGQVASRFIKEEYGI
jgi:choline dehydrogenase